MDFSIRRTRENDLELVYLSHENSDTGVAIMPGYGAAIYKWLIPLKNGELFNLIDSYRDAAEVRSDMSLSYKGPKLSPFPCRIAGGVYHFNGREYRFTRLFPDGSAIHGLLFDRPFSILEATAGAGSATLLIEYTYSRDDPGYPFLYTCQVRYTLTAGDSLEIVTTVTNMDNTAIPVADGWHPYFRLGGRVDGWQLQFHSAALLEFDNQLIPTGRLSPYNAFESPRFIGDSRFDNCFSLKPGIVSAACELFNPANGLRISFYPDASYPYLQLYTPSDRGSFAVENLSGAPDCFNNKMGLVVLAPGHSQIFTVRYKVSVE
jgi:aldose 1-epimerase